ncbi:MAG: alpha/beta hydrolase [Actinobacteria bacterium]|nr:alpha/beta hydrolase [Actinomycetota bacterium]
MQGRPGTRCITAITVATVVAAVLASAPSSAVEPPVSVLSQPVQYATVGGATLGYRSAGSGPPLVLIPGSSNTMAEWDPRMLDELATSHRVIVFDNRGAGTSTGSVERLTIASMARDTAQFIAGVTSGRADVLGWSMGGFIAQELAIRYPERVRRLVLASTDCGGPGTAPPTERALRILTDPDATQADRLSILFPKNRIGAGVAWSTAIGDAFAANGYQPPNSFTVSPATAQEQSLAAGPRWLGEGRGTCDRLARITQRTLIGAGRRDVVSPSVNHKTLSTGIPRSSVSLYEDAGHAFLFQPGLGFTKVIASFLAAR